MTDEEVICQWMEQFYHFPENPAPRWIHRQDLTLDALHEVEARLTDAQWRKYLEALVPRSLSGWTELKDAAYADAPTRIKALAAVLREAKHGA